MTQPESKLSERIMKAMSYRGAYVWKVHGNEYTPAGTPDICGAYRGQFIGVETKMPGGKLSAIQEYRIGRMRMAGALIVAPCFTIAQAVELLDLLQAHADLVPEGRGDHNPRTIQARKRMEVWRQIDASYGRGAM